MASRRKPPIPPEETSVPDEIPANEILRRPKPNVIDQRQQQIDPAGRHRMDVNASAKGSMKQPGDADEAPDDA